MLKSFLLAALVSGIAVLVASKVFTGVRIKRGGAAVTVAVVFALLNLLVGWLIKTVLAVALLPIAALTFGLVYLLLGWVANMILLWITDKLIEDFEVDGFGSLAGAAGLISLAAWLVQRFV